MRCTDSPRTITVNQIKSNLLERAYEFIKKESSIPSARVLIFVLKTKLFSVFPAAQANSRQMADIAGREPGA